MEGFKYYSRSQGKIKNFYNALAIIREDKITLDSKYLEVIEAAEMGYCTAWLELSEGFWKGRSGLPVNYRMARYYFDLMIKECTSDEVYSQYPQLLFETYRSAGYFELDFNNTLRAFEELSSAVKIMVNNIPKQEWDFDIFYYLRLVMLGQNN